ncbi:unnamed protein product [Cuscuta epithymum]|uniref:Uncharacterized protein n=1 Tax=Cuscuta epithymum TaxID=186058 RepID=A0AAV0E6Q8_9ASTE|nr:unnamed protein product [Cuscuta epithymum]CAH9129664.1 unnamed protein product [Cuscuta epithymum]
MWRRIQRRIHMRTQKRILRTTISIDLIIAS